tara:strand:+ start:841 stop:1557 length:717 start_codon:yes stop_codon:yes gene_type:complete
VEEFLSLIKNKNIIITGTSTGIGKKLATNLLKKNNYVWGCSRTNSVINHKNYKHCKIDLENFESLSNWIGKIKKDTREKVDLLICNAAVFNRSLNLHETKKNILKTINVNLSSNIILSKLVSDIMVKRKNGLIIFFSSVATKINQEGSSSYSASKSGIETFSQVLSKELKKYRIKVHTLRIIFFPTRLSKGLNKAGLNNILKKFKSNMFNSDKKIINQIDKIFKNKLSSKTIINDKKK